MKREPKVRVGVIGMGLMGAGHARCLQEGKVPGAVLAASCDPNHRLAGEFPGVPWFDDVSALLRSGTVDAVIVATPHYAHTTVGIAALKAGLHVLVEKPVSVHKADALKLLAAHRDKRQIFAVMLNQRTDPRYRKLRDLVLGGRLGKVRRINWIITDWFRPEAYYRNAGWRATWAGEGGGVLLNQCPHNLDLFQWIFGMPSKAPPVKHVPVPLPDGTGEQHAGILKNFVRAIRHGDPLIAPAADGLASVELANAIIMSAVEDRTVTLPMSAPRYTRLLASLTRRSKMK